MNKATALWASSVLLSALLASSPHSLAQDPTLFSKFCGRVPIFGLRADYPNPASLVPENEDCMNGEDDDGDATIDYADLDCQSGVGPQNLFLKLPLDVIQPVAGFAPAWYTGATRAGNPLAELLINTTGPGGRKLSYLRTDGASTYADVRVRAAILPGAAGDNGGPIAVRIQGADAGAKAGMSYYVKVVPGNRVSIEKSLADGSSVELANATQWTTAEAINILDYESGSPECYGVELTAIGPSLTARVFQVDCVQVLLGIYDTINDRTVTINATDGDLTQGYVGLRSDNDAGGAAIDDAASAAVDASVIDMWIEDTADDLAPTTTPRIAFFNSYSSQVDSNLDYSTSPIGANDGNVYNRSITTAADQSLAAYLRSLGFIVDEYHIASFAAGFLTPDFINENYDLFWLPSSGASSDSRTFARLITIPFIFAEHVDGSSSFAGLWAGTGDLNGNENQVACGTSLFTATLNGGQEAPDPVDTEATGVGTFPYDPATRTLSYNISYSGLSSAETGAHFHNAAAGEPGGVMFPLPAGNPKVGSVELSEADEAELLAGRVYVNIHSSMHQGGEIRGQLVPGTLSPTSIRIIPADKGGDPDHPIVRGLGDVNGNVVIHDSSQFPLNTSYPFPGEGPAGLSGAGFKSVKRVLDERGWGPGCPETQYAGYPPTEGAVALAAMVNPCTADTFWQVDAEGNLTSADGKGHISIMAAPAGTPRLVVDPENCPDPCVFESPIVFYWLSDRAFPYATPATLKILRRSALWAVGLLGSENRSDIPFSRGDANADGKLDISDAVSTLNWLFSGGDEPSCRDAADSNDDEKVDISDAVNSLGYLFLGAGAPPFPGRKCFLGCGLDFTPPAPAEGNEDPASVLSCISYSQCR